MMHEKFLICIIPMKCLNDCQNGLEHELGIVAQRLGDSLFGYLEVDFYRNQLKLRSLSETAPTLSGQTSPLLSAFRKIPDLQVGFSTDKKEAKKC